jgi:lysozyme
VAHVSQRGIDFIKRFEGFRPMAYRDMGGVWTVGYGHTGPDVTEALIITEATAQKLLEADVRHFELCVENALHRDVNQEQFDALVSFAFNVGCHAFQRSTMLKHINAGNHDSAVAEFIRWNKVGEREVEGLTRRRRAEADLYRSGTATA